VRWRFSKRTAKKSLTKVSVWRILVGMRSRLESLLATDAQWSYIRRLMNEAFASHCELVPNIDVHHQPTQYLKADASADIKRLLELKAQGWPRR